MDFFIYDKPKTEFEGLEEMKNHDVVLDFQFAIESLVGKFNPVEITNKTKKQAET